MAIITGYQEEYIKAYEALEKKKINVSGLLMLTEISYDGLLKLVEYKSNPKLMPEDFHDRLNVFYRHLLSTFFKVDSANNIYDTYKELFRVTYLDNEDDETNDYNSETMIKLNKIYEYIDKNSQKDFTGIELLSSIRKEITNKEEELEDFYYDSIFVSLKEQSDIIRNESDFETKMKYIPKFLSDISNMESHLFRKKLFYDDYRKSVTGLMNYLFLRARIPLVYIKPIDLEDYYKYIEKSVDNKDIISFYKEKMADSIEMDLIKPMKKISFNRIGNEVKKYTLKDNDLDRVRVE
jgi:hypothetical protein